MAVREGILLLLREGPKYGYQLKGEFDEHLGEPKPLNIGQVYATLDRLARAGLVIEAQHGNGAPDGHEDPRRRRFTLTDKGRGEVDRWVETPVDMDTTAARTELATKIVLAVPTPGVDELDVIDNERKALVERLQQVRREMRRTDSLTRRLAIDATAARLEADLGWLDRCEERLRAEATNRRTGR